MYPVSHADHTSPVSPRSRVTLIVVGLLIGLVTVELVARAYTAFSIPPKPVDWTVPDARLGWRGNPAFPGHDRRGWRNASPLAHADVVVLGDSQTYGLNAPREAAWPQRLSATLRLPLYQMAIGGYGPAHYLLMFDEAAALKPKMLLVAYYLGNDLTDSYSLAYRVWDYKDVLPTPELDALRSTDPRTSQTIRRAEAIDPDLLRAHFLDCGDPRPVPDARLQRVHGLLASSPLLSLAGKYANTQPADTRADPGPARWSALYRLARPALSRVWHRFVPYRPAWDYGPPICVHYRDGHLQTVFTPAYHLLALSRTDPRVVEGERISLLAYKALAERSRRAGIRFYVVVIPTKETAFRARTELSLRDQPYMFDVWAAETVARSRALTFFSQMGIPAIDTLPAFEAVIASGINPYTESYDGHPAAPGYAAIASAVGRRLQRDGVTGAP